MKDVASDPAAATLPVLPQAIRMAGARLPATPSHLIPAHKAFVKTVDRLRKQFRADAPKPVARRTLTKRDSLSAAVRGCLRVRVDASAAASPAEAAAKAPSSHRDRRSPSSC